MADISTPGRGDCCGCRRRCPYYGLGAPFATRAGGVTKRLVFSSWTVVPQVIAALVSYEAERQMMRSRSGAFGTPRRPTRSTRPLLRFSRRRRARSRSMSLLALLYPSPRWPRIGDPLAVAADWGLRSDRRCSRMSWPWPRSDREAASSRCQGRPTDGPADESWYWAAPLLLDEREDGWNRAWLGRLSVPTRGPGRRPGREARAALGGAPRGGPARPGRSRRARPAAR